MFSVPFSTSINVLAVLQSIYVFHPWFWKTSISSSIVKFIDEEYGHNIAPWYKPVIWLLVGCNYEMSLILSQLAMTIHNKILTFWINKCFYKLSALFKMSVQMILQNLYSFVQIISMISKECELKLTQVKKKEIICFQHNVFESIKWQRYSFIILQKIPAAKLLP